MKHVLYGVAAAIGSVVFALTGGGAVGSGLAAFVRSLVRSLG